MILPFHHSNVPDSPLSRWDSRWKIAALLPAAFGIAAVDHLAPSLTALVLALFALALARLPWHWVRGRLALFGFAALPFVVVLPFTLDSPGSGWDLGPVRFSERGLATGLGVFARCVAIGCLTLILLGTAPLQHSLAAAHRLRLPGLLVLLVGLAHRYAFLLGDEAQRIRIALRTRGFRPNSTRRAYKILGHITGAILVQSSDRADRVTAAMRCRGFDGTFRTTIAFRSHTADLICWLLVVAVAAAIVVWDASL
jgi:cobalt/nickel transport system permease protein